jgi:hypothetical protein
MDRLVLCLLDWLMGLRPRTARVADLDQDLGNLDIWNEARLQYHSTIC